MPKKNVGKKIVKQEGKPTKKYVPIIQAQELSHDPNVKFLTLGSGGVRRYGGFVVEDFLPELNGYQGRLMYKEMYYNSATIGAALTAITQMLRSVEWIFEAAPADKDGKGKEFMESVLFDDMEHTWDDHIANWKTIFVFGWGAFEMVAKRRDGYFPDEPWHDSKFSDGKIGLRKLAPRSQETLWEWAYDNKNNLLGFEQFDPYTNTRAFLPINKLLHYRTTSEKENPEGISMLRNCYRPYYMIKRIEEYEAIAIEREMNGIPIARIPAEVLNDPDSSTASQYRQLVRDLRFNSQAGIVIPSDTHTTPDGVATTTPMYSIELITANGSRAIPIRPTIQAYKEDMAISFLADFLMLGQSGGSGGRGGSFSLAKEKSDIFMKSLEGILRSFSAILNKNLVSQIWSWNGFDPSLQPILKAGKVSPPDLLSLGQYITALTTAGIVVGADQATANQLRQFAGLPEVESSYMGSTGGDTSLLNEKLIEEKINEKLGIKNDAENPGGKVSTNPSEAQASKPAIP